MSSSGLSVVTGGAGFIGSNLVRLLLERGSDVRVLDSFASGRRENLVGLDVEVVEGDVRDREAVRGVVRGASRIFHLAAVVSVVGSVEDPLETHEVNTTGTLNVLMAARDEGVERVVLSSSSAVYGEAGERVDESASAVPPSPYGASKLSAEAAVAAFHGSYGMQAVSLRYFNVFGPRQDPASEYAAVIPRFIQATLVGKPVTIYGDGEQSRDFVFVEDVCRANVLASEAPAEAWGRPFNVATGESRTVNELLREIQEAVGRETVEPLREPPRPGEIRTSAADPSAATRALGFRAERTFREGLERTVEWFRSAL